MKYINKTIEELHELLVAKVVTPLDLVKEAIEELKKEETNAIETLCEKEALELRDGDKSRYMGKGVLNAVNNVNTIIRDNIIGMDSLNQEEIDKTIEEYMKLIKKELDITEADYRKFGAADNTKAQEYYQKLIDEGAISNNFWNVETPIGEEDSDE